MTVRVRLAPSAGSATIHAKASPGRNLAVIRNDPGMKPPRPSAGRARPATTAGRPIIRLGVPVRAAKQGKDDEHQHDDADHAQTAASVIAAPVAVITTAAE